MDEETTGGRRLCTGWLVVVVVVIQQSDCTFVLLECYNCKRAFFGECLVAIVISVVFWITWADGEDERGGMQLGSISKA